MGHHLDDLNFNILYASTMSEQWARDKMIEDDDK